MGIHLVYNYKLPVGLSSGRASITSRDPRAGGPVSKQAKSPSPPPPGFFYPCVFFGPFFLLRALTRELSSPSRPQSVLAGFLQGP